MPIAHRVRAQENFGVAKTLASTRNACPEPGRGRNKVIFYLAAIKHIIAGLMAKSEESQTISRGILQFQEERSTAVGQPPSAGRRFGGTSLWSHFLSHEWSSALLYLFLDIVSWIAVFTSA